MAGEHNHYKVSVKSAKSITQQILYKHAPALFLIIVALSIIFLVQPATALTASGNNATLDSDPLVFTGNHRLPPMNYLENDQIKGLTVEIVKAMAKRMEQPINIELMDWAEAQQLVLDGEADALIQINKTEERELLYDFSDPLLESEFAIFIPADKPGIINILDLRGLTVATEAKGFSILVLERDPLINIKPTPDILSGFNVLLEGLVDAVVADRWVGTYILAENFIRGIAIANHPIDINYSSIAVKKGNNALLADINRALGEIKQDGTYQRIIDNWQRKEVVYKTVEQVGRERLIITASLAALFITAAFVLVLLYTVKKRNQAEQKLADYTLELQDSEEKFRFLVEHSHDLIWTLKADGVFTYVSPSSKAILGYEPSYMIDRTFQTVVYSDDVPKCEEYMYKLIEAGKALPGPEYRVKHADGTWRWHEATGTPVCNSDGVFIYFVGVSRDITERKQAEQALHKKANELQTIMESTQDGILVVDEKRQVIYVNSRFKELWHIKEDKEMLLDDRELLYSILEQLVEPRAFLEEAEKLYPSYRNHLDTLTLIDGRVYERFTRPLIGEGKLLGRLWSFRDITEQKLAEEKLRKMATTDELTELWNRRYFMDATRQELERTRRYNQPFSLLILDLDYFKHINDTLGHAAGDVTLQHLAALMKNILRDVDIPGRLGGEEFGVLLPSTGLKDGVLVAERIRVAVENNPARYAGQTIPFTTSIGVTEYLKGVISVDDLIKEGDEALYKAKQRGRNCTVAAEIES